MKRTFDGWVICLKVNHVSFEMEKRKQGRTRRWNPTLEWHIRAS